MRIGQSKDIHRLSEGRDLVIGGVKIPYEKGLLGHSDADVLLHAVIESLIGAMGLKDIGTHFSEILLEHGYEVVNIDSLIIIEKPKMAPYIDEMRSNIANHLHCDIDRINVKATCGEGLGFIGNGEGAMAEAVCLIDEKK